MKSPLKIVIGCLVVLVILAGLGWFVFLPQFTKNPETQIAALIKALPGDLKAREIKVSSLDKSFSINGLAGPFPYKGKTLTLSVESISGQGLVLSAGQTPGPEKLLDSLRVTGLTLSGPGEGGAEQRVRFASLLLEDIQADVSDYMGAGGGGQAALQKLLDSLLIARVQLEGLDGLLSMAAVPASFTLGNLEFAKVTTKEYGSLSGQTLAITLGQKLTLKAAKLSGKAVNLPSLLVAASQSCAKGDGDILYQALISEVSPLKDLALEPLMISMGDGWASESKSVAVRFPEKAIIWSDGSFQIDDGAMKLNGTARNGHYGGLALDLKNPEGAILSVGVLSSKDIKTAAQHKLEGGNDIRQETTLAEFSGRGLRVDLSKLAAILADPGATATPAPATPSAPAEASKNNAVVLADEGLRLLRNMLRVGAALSMEQLSVRNYVTKQEYPDAKLTVASSLESIEYSDLSLLDYGPMQGANMVMSIGDVLKVRLPAFSAAGMRLPDVLALVSLDPEKADYQREVLAALTQRPLSISGLNFEHAVLEMGQIKAELGKLALDLELGTGKLVWRQELEGLLLPPQFYAMIDEDAALFAADYKKPLELDSLLDLEIAQAGGKGEIALKTFALSEKNLVDCSLSAALPFRGKGEVEGLEGLMKTGPEVFLRAAAARVDDRGLIEALLHMQYSVMQAKKMLPPDSTTATLRQSVLATLQPLAQMQGMTPDLQKIVLGMMKLVEAPGILDIHLNPVQPVNLEQLLMQGGKLPLGADVRYTPRH